jgi:hypothetical protein
MVAMEAMDRVHVVPDARPGTIPTTSYSRAWLLEPDAFHHEYDALYASIESAEGLTRMRWLATQTWRSADPVTHDYVDMLRTGSADDWEVAFDEVHLADWYRVLMAGHVEPVPAVASPKALKDCLPLLGFTPSEARRLAYGRELQSLVETFGSVPVVAQIAPQLTIGSRGWLSHDDVVATIERLRGLDPRCFRDAQEAIPLIEGLYGLLEAARAQPDRVLLLLCG